MCPECGVGFEPNTVIQVFCCAEHRNAWYAGRVKSREFPRQAKCDHCGGDFEQKTDWHRFCSEVCKDRAKHRRDMARPEYVESNRERCREWYRENKAAHLARIAARRRAKQTESVANDQEKPAQDPWSIAAPSMDYLPGGAFTLDMRPRYKFSHDQLSALHGIVTAITGPHGATIPVFSLVPWHSGCGWGCYVSHSEIARLASGKAHGVSFDGGPATMHCGPLMRVKSPQIAPGKHVMTVEAITPVIVRAYGRTVSHVVPCSEHLRGTLEGFLPRRLGVEMPKGTVALELLEDNSRVETLRLRGNGRKLGDSTGWIGSVRVLVNAPGRWLLECAALGLGYGGRVGFGFGRIRVRCET